MTVGPITEISRTVAAARAALGEAAYEALRGEGVRLSRKDALRLTGVPESVLQASPINAVAATRWPTAPLTPGGPPERTEGLADSTQVQP